MSFGLDIVTHLFSPDAFNIFPTITTLRIKIIIPTGRISNKFSSVFDTTYASIRYQIENRINPNTTNRSPRTLIFMFFTLRNRMISSSIDYKKYASIF